jgi:hypothetical protein
MLSYRRARGASQSVWATVAPSYRPDKYLGATSTTSTPVMKRPGHRKNVRRQGRNSKRAIPLATYGEKSNGALLYFI